MKARIVKQTDGTIHLILCSGKIRIINIEEAKAFLLTFNSDEYYIETSQTEYFMKNMNEYDGITLAYVNDSKKLVVESPSFLQDLFFEAQPDYLTATEYAEKHDKKPGIVKRMCRNGRINGAVMKGTQWLIPKDAPYPQDARVGSRVESNNK